VALTRFTDEAYVRQLLSAGAAGYVLKQSPSTELLRAIRAVAAGQRYLDAKVGETTSGRFTPHDKTPRVSTVSDREREVLRLMALGHSNKEIGAALAISVKTVEVHKANAMRKLSLNGRMDVIRFAVLEGWLQDP
jgi:DNA-binding NarL/FixJ family response regulator